MDTKKLSSLIKKDEGQKLDFKLKLDLVTENGKREFVKDICAIANSKGGRGYIIVGIRDKTKEIEGIKKVDMFTEEQIQQIVSARTDPPIPIIVEFSKLNNKNIGIIIICDGKQRPYQTKEHGIFYTRRGSTTDIMRRSELVSAFEDNMELTVETSSVIRGTIDMLDNNLLGAYFNQKGIVINEENKISLLQSSGIINYVNELNDYRCTYGGLLVFSEKNSICIPNNIIKIVKDDSSKIIQGSLISMIDKAERELNNMLPENYPKNAVFEAIKNAILYREYADVNKVIEVIIDDSNIIITSPGDFIDKNINSNNPSCSKRNMWIYEKLITLDSKKRFLNNGNGLSRIRQVFRGKGKVKFINSNKENCFKVILPYNI